MYCWWYKYHILRKESCLKGLSLTWQFGTSVTIVFLRTWRLLLHFCLSPEGTESLWSFLSPISSPLDKEHAQRFLNPPRCFLWSWLSLSCPFYSLTTSENQTALLRFAGLHFLPTHLCLVLLPCVFSPATSASPITDLIAPNSPDLRGGMVAAYESSGRHEGKELGLRLKPVPGRSHHFYNNCLLMV